MSPTSSSPSRTRIRWESVTSPITEPPTSQRSHSASTSSTLAGSTTHSMRSCDSETITSKGSMSGSRSGTRLTSRSIPTPPLLAISDAEEVRPAAPRSCSDTSRPRCNSSSEHSISFFSSNGSPTCTLGRLSSVAPSSESGAPSSAEASTEAPPMPPRPVAAPNSTRTFPGPADPRRCALEGLDGARVVVRLDLERAREPSADIHRAGVLPRPDDHMGAAGGERAQQLLGVLVGAVLAPQKRVHRQLERVRRAALLLAHELVLLARQAKREGIGELRQLPTPPPRASTRRSKGHPSRRPSAPAPHARGAA